MKTFDERVVDLALSIPHGKVTTYEHLAKAAGSVVPLASERIARILHDAHKAGVKNIPLHRIISTDGRLFLDRHSHVEDLELMRNEHIVVDKDNRVENLHEVLHKF